MAIDDFTDQATAPADSATPDSASVTGDAMPGKRRRRRGKRKTNPDDFPPSMAEQSRYADPEDAEMSESEEMEQKLQAFGNTLAQTRDKWVRSRYSQGIDRRMRDDLDQYHGRDNLNRNEDLMEAVEQGAADGHSGGERPPVAENRSKIFIQLTRQKSNTAEARLSDILIPTDDRNWGIQPTPKPELARVSKDQSPARDFAGNQMTDQDTNAPLTKEQVVAAINAQANTACTAMGNEIDDQLNECSYNGEQRKVMHDACVVGWGVIKGPIPTTRSSQRWRPQRDGDGDQVQVIEVVREIKPASFRVDPANFWPDPACGESLHNGQGCFERKRLTPKQVRALLKEPGYLENSLRQVLDAGPRNTKAAVADDAIFDEMLREILSDVYDMWEYWGEINTEDLMAAGVPRDQLELHNGEIDPLHVHTGCVVMIGNVVVKAYLNPLDTNELPFDMFVWERITNSCYGYGIPHMMRAQQRVVNAAWRQLMDNSALSSGAQVVMRKTGVQPANGSWELEPRKVWHADEDVDVTKAFATFEFNSHQQELEALIEMAMKIVDEETGVPMMLGGEQGTAPETVGGMQLLMNNANVVLKRLVKQWDDMISRPHIKRYYDYNMMYGDDESIKGDFQIDARGSSALVVRDIQNQAYNMFMQSAGSPLFAPYMDIGKLLKLVMKAQHVNPTDIMYDDARIEKNLKAAAAAPPPAPQVQAAQIRSQAELERAKAMSEADIAKANADVEKFHEQQIYDMEKLRIEREIAILKLASEQKQTLQQIQADLGKTAIQDRTKKELAAAEIAFHQNTGEAVK